jgi:anti-sigma B factor antagonist
MTALDARLRGPTLVIERQREGQDLILVVRGEIDMASADRFEAALTDALAGDCSRILIDLADLEFMDSTGLRTLIQGQRQAASRGLPVILRHVPHQATRLFELTGLARAFVSE